MQLEGITFLAGYNSDFPAPPSIGQIGCPYPVEGTVFDLMFDAKQRSFWRPWTEIIKHSECPETTNISSILVPTVESARWEKEEGQFWVRLGEFT